MILPYANGECVNIFLEKFSDFFSNYRVIMGMDNASWHSINFTEKLDNIVPLFQPAHSPELNPAENIWHYIRENGNFKNRNFSTMEDVEEQLIIAINALLADKDKIKSITNFGWVKQALSGNMIAV